MEQNLPTIDLLTGFLGAGKTTFIARYGEWLNRQGIRFAVIENEFGAAGVDTALLNESFGNVHELAGGCICCTLKSGFFNMLGRLAPHCDRIIVEPSGLYNLDDYFEVVDAIERNGIGRIGMCLTLVDPHTLPWMTEEELGILHDELEGTGGVLWTKIDEAPACDLDEAAASVLECLGGEDAELLFYPKPSHALEDEDFARLQQLTPVRRKHRRVSKDHRAMYQSASLRPKGIYEAKDLLEKIDGIIASGECGEILRIKGIVGAEDGSLTVNCTVSDRLVEPWAERKPMLNVIGHNINRARIKELLEEWSIAPAHRA